MDRLRKEYELYKERGELFLLFPFDKLTGEWESDKGRFAKLHEDFEKSLNIKLIDPEEL